MFSLWNKTLKQFSAVYRFLAVSAFQEFAQLTNRCYLLFFFFSQNEPIILKIIE